MNTEGRGFPTECTMNGSILFPPFEKLREVQKEVEDCIADAVESDSWLRDNPPSIVWLFGAQGMEMSEDHPLFQIASNAIKTVTGANPFQMPMHAATSFFNTYLYGNIPSLGFGPLSGDLTSTGSHDEWVNLPDYIRAIKVTAQIIAEWCK